MRELSYYLNLSCIYDIYNRLMKLPSICYIRAGEQISEDCKQSEGEKEMAESKTLDHTFCCWDNFNTSYSFSRFRI